MHETATATAVHPKPEKPFQEEAIRGYRLEVFVTHQDVHSKPSAPHFVIKGALLGGKPLPEYHLQAFRNNSSSDPGEHDKAVLQERLEEIRRNLPAL